MKYYLKDNKWHSINNNSSKYWEIHKGFANLKMVEITRPNMEGFGWNSEKGDHIILTTKGFIKFLKRVKKEHRYMLNRINKTLEELRKNKARG